VPKCEHTSQSFIRPSKEFITRLPRDRIISTWRHQSRSHRSAPYRRPTHPTSVGFGLRRPERAESRLMDPKSHQPQRCSAFNVGMACHEDREIGHGLSSPPYPGRRRYVVTRGVSGYATAKSDGVCPASGHVRLYWTAVTHNILIGAFHLLARKTASRVTRTFPGAAGGPWSARASSISSPKPPFGHLATGADRHITPACGPLHRATG
jgi:hypothetical protein